MNCSQVVSGFYGFITWNAIPFLCDVYVSRLLMLLGNYNNFEREKTKGYYLIDGGSQAWYNYLNVARYGWLYHCR